MDQTLREQILELLREELVIETKIVHGFDATQSSHKITISLGGDVISYAYLN